MTVPGLPDSGRASMRDLAALTSELPPELRDEVAQLARERDHLVLLQNSLVEASGAGLLEARLRVLVEATRQIGFGRVVLTLRDAELNPSLVVTAGLTPSEDRELRDHPAGGGTWRRRIPLLDRFRISQSWYLDGRDPWIVSEFHGGLPSAMSSTSDDPQWSSSDTLLVPLRRRDGTILALLALDDPDDRRRPLLSRVRTVELFGQQVAHTIEQDQLASLAERRSAQLHRLQEASASLARSLDETEILRELARQTARVVEAAEVTVLRPDLERGNATVVATAGTRARMPLGPEVALRGAALRASRAGHPAIGLAAAGNHEIAAPLLAGSRLEAVAVASRGDPFDHADEERLATIAAQAVTAIVNARLYAESERERRLSEALADVARAVSESLRVDEVLHLILRHAVALLHTEGAIVTLREGDHLRVVAGLGSGELIAGMHLPLEASLNGRVVRTGTYVIANDVGREPDVYLPTQRVASVSSAIVVPLVTATGVIGTLSVLNRSAPFLEADARVMQRLADHVAVAIVNARLFEEAADATRQWAVAFDAMASGLAVLDAAGIVRRCNIRGAELLGVASPASAVSGLFRTLLLGSRDDEGALPSWPPLVRSRVTVHATARGRVFELVSAPHPDGGAVVTFDDVTAHHTLAERHRRVLETAGDAIVITDTDRCIAFANPAALELFGTPAGVMGLPVSRLVPPEFREAVRAREDGAFSGVPQRYEAAVLRPDGERRTVSVSTAPLVEVGQVTGVVASLRDITSEQRARDALSLSEARYRNLFETATDAIYTIDVDGVFTSANDAACRITGRTRDVLLGRRVDEFLEPGERVRVRAQFRRARTGEASHYECTIIAGDGALRRMSVTNTPIRRGRDVVGVLGIARDVTEERERAVALARSEAKYARLVESASDGIFTVDRDGRFTSANRALELATGLTRADLLGASIELVVDDRDRALIQQVLTETLSGARAKAEVRYRSSAGTLREMSMITSPLIEEDGSVSGGLAVVRDVSDERRLMSQMLQQEKLAALGQLVSGVAHELNNPLAGVMAFSQLLLAAPSVQGEEREATETIHHEAQRAARIVTKLLTFARQHTPERRSVDLNEIAIAALELRRYVLRANDVRIDMRLDDDLPRTAADAFQLQQVVLNLYANAEHALAERGAGRVLTVMTGVESGLLVLTVGDNGAGIPADRLARIFDPFFTTKPVGEGTGLGLSISDGIVREHGGRIRAESVPGDGASFTIELPIVALDPAAEPKVAGHRSAAMSPAAGRVLVVDDEVAIRRAVATFLRRIGHEVDTAATGAEALDRLAHQRYAALLLDLRLPDMPGDAVYGELARRDPAQARRVIFMTGDVRSDAAEAFIRATGRPLVPKPFELDDLAFAVASAIAAGDRGP